MDAENEKTHIYFTIRTLKILESFHSILYFPSPLGKEIGSKLKAERSKLKAERSKLKERP
jgi:hypothetical protein